MEKNRLNIYLSDEDHNNLIELAKRMSLPKSTLAVFLIKIGLISVSRGLDNKFDTNFKVVVTSEETGEVLSISK